MLLFLPGLSADSTPYPLHLLPVQKYVSLPSYITTVLGAPQAHQQQRRSTLSVYNNDREIFFKFFSSFTLLIGISVYHTTWAV